MLVCTRSHVFLPDERPPFGKSSGSDFPNATEQVCDNKSDPYSFESLDDSSVHWLFPGSDIRGQTLHTKLTRRIDQPIIRAVLVHQQHHWVSCVSSDMF